MKDYYENKIKQIKKQIKKLNKEIDTTEKAIDFDRRCLQQCDETMVCAPEILIKEIEYRQCKIHSIRRNIAALEEEIEKTVEYLKKQRENYSANENCVVVSVWHIVEHDGFIGGRRL